MKKELVVHPAPISTVDPRVRMKEIRVMVASHMKGGPVNKDLGHLAHLGDLPDNMEDARRVIIALQDQLDTEQTKHKKATVHVCELVHTMEHMSEVQQELMNMVYQRDRTIHSMGDRLDRQELEIASLYKRSEQNRRERDAVLTTMSLQANMKAPEPMIIPVQMGSSNAAEKSMGRLYNALTNPLPMMAMGLNKKDHI